VWVWSVGSYCIKNRYRGLTSEENLKIQMLRRRLLLLLIFDDDKIVDLLFLIDLRKYFSLMYEQSPLYRETIRYDLRFEDISQSDVSFQKIRSPTTV